MSATLEKDDPTVNYRVADQETNKRCGTCDMFDASGNSCDLVKGYITATHVCDRWEAKGE